MHMGKLACGVLFAIGFALPAYAVDIIEDWAKVQVPPPPALKTVNVDSKTAALLVIDMVKETCNVRPRCMESIPAVQKLLNEARKSGVMIVYTLGPAGKQFVDALAPQDAEPIVRSGADKFINTELDKILKDKGIKSVIVVGTLANGGVLHTASDAALRGFSVAVPVDGMSSPDTGTLYTEQYTAWHLANATVFGGRVMLTRSDMMKF